MDSPLLKQRKGEASQAQRLDFRRRFLALFLHFQRDEFFGKPNVIGAAALLENLFGRTDQDTITVLNEESARRGKPESYKKVIVQVEDVLEFLAYLAGRVDRVRETTLWLVNEVNKLSQYDETDPVEIGRKDEEAIFGEARLFYRAMLAAAPGAVIALIVFVFGLIVQQWYTTPSWPFYLVGFGVLVAAFKAPDSMSRLIRPISFLYRTIVGASLVISAMYLGTVAYYDAMGKGGAEQLLTSLPRAWAENRGTVIFGFIFSLVLYGIIGVTSWSIMAEVNDQKKPAAIQYWILTATSAVVAYPVFRATGFFFQSSLYDGTVAGIVLLGLRIAATIIFVLSPFLLLEKQTKVVGGLATYFGVIVFSANNALTAYVLCENRKVDAQAVLKALVALVQQSLSGQPFDFSATFTNEVFICLSIWALILAAELYEQESFTAGYFFMNPKMREEMGIVSPLNLISFLTGLAGLTLGFFSTFFMLASQTNVLETRISSIADLGTTLIVLVLIAIGSFLFEFAPEMLFVSCVKALTDTAKANIAAALKFSDSIVARVLKRQEAANQDAVIDALVLDLASAANNDARTIFATEPDELIESVGRTLSKVRGRLGR